MRLRWWSILGVFFLTMTTASAPASAVPMGPLGAALSDAVADDELVLVHRRRGAWHCHTVRYRSGRRVRDCHGFRGPAVRPAWRCYSRVNRFGRVVRVCRR